MATRAEARSLDPSFAELLAEVQSYGVKVEEVIEAREAGAGPADAGMVYIDGSPVTFPFVSEFVEDSPFTIRRDDDGWALFRDGQRLASAAIPPRPNYYELFTADGIPYWQIALLHLDSLASTVVQTCVYWGNDDQCRFCAIERSLEAGRTIPVKRPEQLAEVASAAVELDQVVDVTLTTGTTRGPDKGALYVSRCAEAVKEATDLPVQVQFEPPDDLGVLDEVHARGVDTVGIHVETFDQAVLDRVAPAKGRTGVEGYFRCWERAVELFGPGQVTTYVILGMGEDPQLTAELCRRAVDIGVYPFIVPLRPIPGSLFENELPPAPDYVESMYRQIVPYLVAKGLGSWEVNAGCARCRACSGMALIEELERERDASGRRQLPLIDVR
jgi:radical SAM protein (TIGR04043 family)